MDISVSSRPTTSAILSAELLRLKTFLRIETDDEDTDLQQMHVAAADIFEKLTGRAVFTTGRVLRLPPCLEDRVIELPYPNLIAVQSVKYYDSDDVEQTVSSGEYIVETGPIPGRVTFTDTGIETLTGDLSEILRHPISINFTTGFGADTDSVPLGIRNVMREITKWLYAVKNNANLSRNGIPEYISHLAGVWRVGRIW